MSPSQRIKRQAERLKGKSIRFSSGRAELSAAQGEGSPVPFILHAYSGGYMYPQLAMNWRGPVVCDLAGMSISAPLPVHRDHDTTQPVGHADKIENSGRELVAYGVFSMPGDCTDELIASAKNGFPWKASVGLKIDDYTTIEEGRTVDVNMRTFQGPLLLVTASTLQEISFVTVPGDSETSADVLAQLGEADMPTFEEWVASLGLDPAALSEEAKSVLMKQYAETAEDAAEVPPVQAEAPVEPVQAMDGEKPEEAPVATASAAVDLTAQLNKAAAETLQRSREIEKLCAKFGNPEIKAGRATVSLAAHAVAEGWSVDQTELYLRRQQDLQAHRDQRPMGPAIHSTSKDQRATVDALQGAFLLRAGARLDSRVFEDRRIKPALPQWLKAGVNDPVRQRAMDAAHEFSSMSLYDMTCHFLRASGNGDAVRSNKIDTIQNAFRPQLKAAFSAMTVADLFGQTMGARVLEGYGEVRDFTAGWTSEAENPDLEQHARIRMEAAQNLKYHPTGGDANHATRITRTENTQVYRFSRQLEIDEADILGDNFGKLAETPRDFGLAAGRVRPDLGANVILANANLSATSRALFNTTDGNKFGSAALTRSTLSAAIAAMAKFKDGDATLNLAPSHILVPPDLYDLAVQLTMSAVNATTTTDQGNMNPLYAYGIQPISEARLANGITDPIAGTSRSGSTSTWYLISREAHTIEFTYLQGAGRAPQVRTTELVNGRFGLNMDVRLYIGAKALDWRGMVYNQSGAL